MSRIPLIKGLIRNLKGEVPRELVKLFIDRPVALRLLIEKTGENFGYDIEAWEEWYRENGEVPFSRDEITRRE